MKKMWKAAACLCMAGTVVGATAACGERGTTNKEGTVRIFTYTGNEYEAVTMDSAMKKIEDKVGLKFSFEGASTEDYYTKLTPMMGTGDWPDLIWCDPENSSGAFQIWSDPKQDALYNLDDLLSGNAERYPYLTKLIYSPQYGNIMYHGGHYLVPEVQTSTAWSIYYRADWLEQIGFTDESGKAKTPETLDEFEYVMSKFSGEKLFTDAKGQKTGKTYGISPNTSSFYVNPLYGAFGITPDWDVTDRGDVSYMYAREEFKPYLSWMNAMYKKGYIDPTFNQNVGFNDREAWYDGKVGCIMTNGEAHMEWVVGNFDSAQGAGKVIVGAPPVGTGNVSALTGATLGVKGERGFSDWGGYYGGYAITKGTKDAYKTLDLLEYLVSPEGSKLRLYGIEGKHYTVSQDGSIVADTAGRENERINYFAEVTESNGTKSTAGLHKIGSLFGYALDWEKFEQTGKTAIATDISSLYPKYSALVKQAIGYTQYLQTSKMLNVTAFPSTIDSKKAEVMALSSQFVNKAIVGTVNLSSDWTQMLTNLDKAGYKTVQAVMRETATELGIIS